MGLFNGKILGKLGAALVAVAGCLLVLPQPARAEVAPRVLGVDAGVLIPISTLADVVGMSYGGMIRYEQKSAPNMSFTGRAGLFRGSAKDTALGSWALDGYCLWVGGVYRLQPASDGLFLSGEIGANFVQFRAPNSTQSDPGAMSTKFGAVVGAGYRADVLTVRAALDMYDLTKAADTMGLFLSVGWDFKGL
ncbi:MAG: hypothetical protein HY902_17945 [Deltaproteobacteria bacterium]|nr:hypothetical protein [Deltaproteobacteria bacterium]